MSLILYLDQVFLVGGGFEVNDTRYGLTYYSDVGGDANSDVTFLYAGVKF